MPKLPFADLLNCDEGPIVEITLRAAELVGGRGRQAARRRPIACVGPDAAPERRRRARRTAAGAAAAAGAVAAPAVAPAGDTGAAGDGPGVPAAIAAVAQRRRPVTALRTPADGPVRDTEGTPVWRIRVASAQELTCLRCGETNLDGRCWRCGKGVEAAKTPMAPTVSYLNPDEYELIMRKW